MRHKPDVSVGTRSGQLIVELMVALSILMMGLMAMLGVLVQSLGLVGVVNDNYAATYLAAEGIEVVKNLIDANVIQGNPFDDNFSDGSFEVDWSRQNLPLDAYDPNHVLASNPGTRLLDYNGPNETTFTREIQIVRIPESVTGAIVEIKVNSIVRWKARKGGSEINLEDHFFDNTF